MDTYNQKDELSIVYDQFELVRSEGNVNMISISDVMREAYVSNHYNLVTYLSDIQSMHNTSAKYMEFLNDFSKHVESK